MNFLRTSTDFLKISIGLPKDFPKDFNWTFPKFLMMVSKSNQTYQKTYPDPSECGSGVQWHLNENKDFNGFQKDFNGFPKDFLRFPTDFNKFSKDFN